MYMAVNETLVHGLGLLWALKETMPVCTNVSL